VSPVLANADLRFGNLECTLSERGLRPHDYHSVQMRGHARYVEGLVDTGFHVLNVANNHSMQHGREPFDDTVDMLRAAGISVCGVSQEMRAHRDRHIHGCVSHLLATRSAPAVFHRTPLYAEGSPRASWLMFGRARPTCDVLVVSLHWGDEFIDRPSPADVQLAHAIVDAGADLIVGHHHTS
jgi:poly-gamma-glutamate synthesis protein (capsule biosynthesis protein)